MEPSEREIIIRKDNEDTCWQIYIAQGAKLAAKFMKYGTITHKDKNGVFLKLPIKCISVRNPVRKPRKVKA